MREIGFDVGSKGLLGQRQQNNAAEGISKKQKSGLSSERPALM
jgi:hypothetical protein